MATAIAPAFFYKITIVAKDTKAVPPEVWQKLDNLAEHVVINVLEQPEFWIGESEFIEVGEIVHKLTQARVFHSISFEQREGGAF